MCASLSIKMEERFSYFATEGTGRKTERKMLTPLAVIVQRGELLLCCLLPSFLNSFLSG